MQIVINPIKNSDGTHNCYVSIRFEIPVQSLPDGINLPSGIQPTGLSGLTADELKSQATTAILSQPECGVPQEVAFAFANISGNTPVEVAQSLIDFCKSYNYFWAVRAVIDLILRDTFPQFQSVSPSSPLSPQIDLGFKVMGGTVFNQDLKGSIVSAEAMFPFSSTDVPDAINFATAMLRIFDGGIPQNIFSAGYLSLRACGPHLPCWEWNNLERWGR